MDEGRRSLQVGRELLPMVAHVGQFLHGHDIFDQVESHKSDGDGKGRTADDYVDEEVGLYVSRIRYRSSFLRKA